MERADKTASRAGHQLAMARWQSTRPDRLIRELVSRSDELGPSQIDKLAAIVGERDTTTPTKESD